MSIATPALSHYRRRGLETTEDHVLAACFVLEPHMAITAGVVASLHPASILQVHGGARCTNDATVAKTIEHAVEKLGVRTVIVCAEERLPPEMTPRRERLFFDLHTLVDHPWLGRMFREHDVRVEALWFDTVEGDIHRWDSDQKRFELLADDGLHGLILDIRRRGLAA